MRRPATLAFDVTREGRAASSVQGHQWQLFLFPLVWPPADVGSVGQSQRRMAQQVVDRHPHVDFHVVAVKKYEVRELFIDAFVLTVILFYFIFIFFMISYLRRTQILFVNRYMTIGGMD